MTPDLGVQVARTGLESWPAFVAEVTMSHDRQLREFEGSPSH